MEGNRKDHKGLEIEEICVNGVAVLLKIVTDNGPVFVDAVGLFVGEVCIHHNRFLL